MASLLLGLRLLAVSWSRWVPVRGKKRWLRPYLRALEKQRELAGPPKPIPRLQQPNFDYHAEVLAFSQRLNESFSIHLLKTAFVNKTYVVQEEQQRQQLGLDKETAMLNLQDNEQLSDVGSEFTASYLQNALAQSFPNLPPDSIKSLVDHLTGQEVICHVAQNLAVEDLTLSSECPLDPLTIHRTLFAIIGALLQSSGTQRAGLFIRGRDQPDEIHSRFQTLPQAVASFFCSHLELFISSITKTLCRIREGAQDFAFRTNI